MLVVVVLALAQTNTGNAQQLSTVSGIGDIATSTLSDVNQYEFVLDAPPARVEAIAARYGLTIVRPLDAHAHGVFLVRGPGTTTTDELVSLVANDAEVSHFELNGLAIAPEVPSGIHLDESPISILDSLPDRGAVDYFGDQAWTHYVSQPATTAIHLADAQRAFATGAGIVAIIDTGVDQNHPLLRNSLVAGYDFVSDAAGPGSEWSDLDPSTAAILDESPISILDQVSAVPLNQSTVAIVRTDTATALQTALLPPAFGHGTMVAGLVHLVAPTAKIMPLKAFKGDGSSRVFDIVRAIYYAVEHGARVINMSFSTTELSPEITHAINFATEQGVICVSSAGNSGRQLLVYPAALRNVLGIGSTNSATPPARSAFSNYGNALVRLGTPGEGVITTYPGGLYVGAWGTSFSTALTSGAAALLLQVDPLLDQGEVQNALGRADKMPSAGMGKGRMNLVEALGRVRDEIAPTVSFVTPAGGSPLWQTVLVTTSASDNLRVAGVKLLVDNQPLGAELTSAPYEFKWNTTAVSNGPHTLTAVARDPGGNSASSTLAVSVSNDKAAPSVTVTSPAASATVNGTITIAASASDDVEVVGVQFVLDGVALGASVTAAPYQLTLSTATLANGSHLLTAVARDAAGNQATATGVPVTVFNDTSPPTVAVTSPASGATVTGTVTLVASATDEGTVASLQFMVDGTALGAPDVAAPYEAAWSTLSVPNGTHSVTAFARDAAGNEATAPSVTVTVANDTTPPTVVVTSPAHGATVTGAVTLTASAADDGAVSRVQFVLDGTPLGVPDVTAPYELAWSTLTVPNGPHTIAAVARDGAGNEGTAAAVTVTVGNDTTAPTIALTSPAAGATLTGAVTLGATATDEGTIASVQFLLDGVALGAADVEAPYETAWSTVTASNGLHILTATARDGAGNEARSASVTVTVANDTTAPSVVLTSPAAGATVTGTVALAANATDDGTVASVEFLLDGTALGAPDVTAPYEIAWSTLGVANGAHAIAVVARDGAGNEARSASITVTVANDTTAPTVALIRPAAGATVTGTVALAANATDDGTMASVQFLLDGTALGASDVTAPYEITWSTLGVANGAHAIAVVARDGAGNEATSASITVTVANDITAPTVAVTSPAPGAAVAGSVMLTAGAVDDLSVPIVQFLLDGVVLGAAVAAAPYELAWSTLAVPNGTHTITAVAHDAAGNEAIAAGITLVVANEP